MEEIMAFQREFNKKHTWDFASPKNKKERLRNIEYGTIALAGEVGEFANLVKKISRNHILTKKISTEKYPALKEELVDVFIYVVILALSLNMDLKEEYFKKMEKNKKTFEKYRKKKEYFK